MWISPILPIFSQKYWLMYRSFNVLTIIIRINTTEKPRLQLSTVNFKMNVCFYVNLLMPSNRTKACECLRNFRCILYEKGLIMIKIAKFQTNVNLTTLEAVCLHDFFVGRFWLVHVESTGSSRLHVIDGKWTTKRNAPHMETHIDIVLAHLFNFIYYDLFIIKNMKYRI